LHRWVRATTFLAIWNAPCLGKVLSGNITRMRGREAPKKTTGFDRVSTFAVAIACGIFFAHRNVTRRIVIPRGVARFTEVSIKSFIALTFVRSFVAEAVVETYKRKISVSSAEVIIQTCFVAIFTVPAWGARVAVPSAITDEIFRALTCQQI